MSNLALATHDVGSNTARVTALLAILVAAALCATGCSASSAPHAQNGFSGMKPASTTTSKMASMAKDGTAKGMVCAECSGHGKAAPVAGTATVENGVQLVKISLKAGRYVPSEFTIQSSMPVRVSFEGTATGCLGHPTFKSLNKTADIAAAPASLDLGTLKPGAYNFSCAMGMNSGTISVQ